MAFAKGSAGRDSVGAGDGGSSVRGGWRQSLAVRCTLATVAVLLIGFVALSVLVKLKVESSLQKQYRNMLHMDATDIAARLTDAVLVSDSAGAAQAAMSIVTGRQSDVIGVRAVRFGTGPVLSYVPLPDAAPFAASDPPTAPFESVAIVDGGESVYFRVPIRNGDGAAAGAVEVAYSLSPLRAEISKLMQDLLSLQAVTLVVAAAAVFLLLRLQLTNPLSGAISAMLRIAEDYDDVLLPVARSSEIAQINDALCTLRDSIGARRAIAERSAEAQRYAAKMQQEREVAITAARFAETERVTAREARAQHRLQEQKSLQDAVQQMLSASAEGNFTLRLPIDGAPEDQVPMRSMLNSLNQRIEAAVDDVIVVLSDMAEGRLAARMAGLRDGTFAVLQKTTNQAAEQVQGVFEKIYRHSSDILDETSDLSASAEELSKRTERTAGSLAETAGALEQITGSIAATAKLARSARGSTEAAREDARQSDVVVKEAIESMRQIQAASAEISRTLGVINDIAFQTNLLALNAGVEAARAGEAGRGFAVVASEVRALAQRAANAAQQIGDLIATSSGQIKLGVQRVARTGETLVTLGERIDRIGDQVAEIALAADDQSMSVAEINRAMGEIDAATQQNTAMFEEMSTANLSLKASASQMLMLIETFDRTNGAMYASSTRRSEGADIASRKLERTAPAMHEFGVLTANAESVRKWDMALADDTDFSDADAAANPLPMARS